MSSEPSDQPHTDAVAAHEAAPANDGTETASSPPPPQQQATTEDAPVAQPEPTSEAAVPPPAATAVAGVPQADVDEMKRKHAEELAAAKRDAETANTKLAALHNENHSLLSRSISSEQQIAELIQERDKLKQQLSKGLADQFVANGGAGGSATEVSLLELIEHERANAKKHNELRLSVETNFADLSMQYETLQQEYDDLRSRCSAAEDRGNRLQSELKDMKETNQALETNLSELAETKERLLAELASLLKKLEDEKAHHEQTKQACLKAHAVMRQMEEDMEAARLREVAAKRELEALKKKAAAWKKQAEAMQEVEARNEQLMLQLQTLTRENLALKKSILDLQRTIEQQQEEERIRRSQEISPKMYQYLKDQFDELRKKYDELRASEKGWHKERDEMLIRIKRLTNELRSKNPSALRMMEVEVQNELLMNLLQSNAGLAASSASPTTVGSSSSLAGVTSPASKRALAPVAASKSGAKSTGGATSSPTPTASKPRVLPPIADTPATADHQPATSSQRASSIDATAAATEDELAPTGDASNGNSPTKTASAVE